ncbi:hypothetical protein WK15_11845 [Burkholderia ubonensis]|nr:hypothetical protein [Burkholderia ubonensis]KVR27846.1 hypothetical protein WK15_11845 [Burkholderia ubonensis]KWB94007.1 hypothetical protein WL45_15860 [Burkholderia ubonensis]KWC17464.1 hypothetical protein WL46_26755 [Burkholderia ubonensis]
MTWKITLADDWKRLHRRGTVILSSALAAISAFGPTLRDAWQGMPDDLKTIIPAHVQQGIGYAILFASIVAVRYTTVRRVAPPDAAAGQRSGDGAQ